MIRDFIKKNGIDIHKSLVFATDDPKLGLMGTVQQRKAEVIARLYNMGYRLFVFFDDNLNNLRAAKSLERIYDDATILIKKTLVKKVKTTTLLNKCFFLLYVISQNQNLICGIPLTDITI